MSCDRKCLQIVILFSSYMLCLKAKDIFISVEEEMQTHPDDFIISEKLDLKHAVNEHVKPIANVNDLINPFINDNCLIVITRFRIIDLLLLSFPAVSLKLQPVYLHAGNLRRRAFWHPQNPNNVNNSESCPSDRFWVNYCSELALIPFSLAHRPWNCIIEINIHPTLPETLLLKPITLEYSQHPPLVPSIEIIVDETQVSLESSIYEDICISSTNRVSNADGRERFNAYRPTLIFLIARLVSSSASVSEYIADVTEYIGCRPGNTKHVRAWADAKKGNFIWNFTHTTNIHIADGHKESRTSFQAVMLSCHNPLTLETSTFEKALQNLKSWNIKLITAQAYLVHLILANYSIVNGLNKFICTTETGSLKMINAGKQAKLVDRDYPQETIKVSSLADSMILFENTAFALRFVVCGSRKQSALPFDQLHNVFLLNVWVTIGICFICTAAVLVKVNGSHGGISVFGHVFAIYKALVEQNNPFRLENKGYDHAKLILLGIFGACILLSNAYRSKNVFQMVLPRQRLAYQKVSQLNEENYTFFTQTQVIHIAGAYWAKRGDPEFERPQGHRLEPFEFWEKSWRFGWRNLLVSYSDWADYGRMSIFIRSAMSDLYSDQFHTKENSGILELLGIRVSVHPYMLTHCLSHVDNVTSYPAKFNFEALEELNREVVEWYFETEKSLLIETIAKCEKVAVIATSLTLTTIQRSLATRNIPVDIGTEYITNGIKGIKLDGNLGPKLFKRLWGMRESGIINWWHIYLDPYRDLRNTPDITPVSPAKISGNILVVFVVLMVGISISGLVFLLEQGSKLFIILKVFGHFVNTKISELKCYLRYGFTRSTKVIILQVNQRIVF